MLPTGPGVTSLVRVRVFAGSKPAFMLRFSPIKQVLHLMNKMNLPCPFGPVTARPPMVSLFPV